MLVISGDPITENLPGIGVRAVELARGLSQFCDVTLAAPENASPDLQSVQTIAFERDNQHMLGSLIQHAEIIIAQGFTLHRYPVIGAEEKYLVIDLYDPYYLEGLALFSGKGAEYPCDDLEGILDTIVKQLRRGDFFICASERQRDLWLGGLMMLGRLNLPNYAHDPTFRSLIDVVPFGCPETPPVHTRQVLKGVVPGIAETDTVVLWGGGIWDWLDPLTVIRAMAIARDRRPDMKLFFMGNRHPNPTDVPDMKMQDQALALAQNLDLLGKTVFFNDRWVPYAERANYLLEADIGVSAHFDHIECLTTAGPVCQLSLLLAMFSPTPLETWGWDVWRLLAMLQVLPRRCWNLQISLRCASSTPARSRRRELLFRGNAHWNRWSLFAPVHAMPLIAWRRLRSLHERHPSHRSTVRMNSRRSSKPRMRTLRTSRT